MSGSIPDDVVLGGLPAQKSQSGTALSALGSAASMMSDADGASSNRASTDSIVQYVVLRRDLWGELGWPLGSIVAQACHASTAALWASRNEPNTSMYCAPDEIDHMHKVVLEIKGETQLRNLAQKLEAAGVNHKLWIEQPEDFATALATAPAWKSEVGHHFKKLKLCKGLGGIAAGGGGGGGGDAKAV